jgi:hypothetical protein
LSRLGDKDGMNGRELGGASKAPQASGVCIPAIEQPLALCW